MTSYKLFKSHLIEYYRDNAVERKARSLERDRPDVDAATLRIQQIDAQIAAVNAA